jgi:hypothetical protein
VFRGGEQHTLFHEAGGVADAGYVAAVGLDFKVIEIDSAKNDPRIRRRRHQANTSRNGGVEANSTGLDGAFDGRLNSHELIRCI